MFRFGKCITRDRNHKFGSTQIPPRFIYPSEWCLATTSKIVSSAPCFWYLVVKIWVSLGFLTAPSFPRRSRNVLLLPTTYGRRRHKSGFCLLSWQPKVVSRITGLENTHSTFPVKDACPYLRWRYNKRTWEQTLSVMWSQGPLGSDSVASSECLLKVLRGRGECLAHFLDRCESMINTSYLNGVFGLCKFETLYRRQHNLSLAKAEKC